MPRFVWTEYNRTKIIQHGSFATLYKGTPIGDDRRLPEKAVAIKIATRLDSPDRNNSPDVEASFLRSLAHPYTIPLLDTIPGPGGVPALVLEYCPTDLFSLLQFRNDDRLPIRTYLKQLLTGVAHFHAHDTVHCDLKPENLLINPKGILKICDFGFAETVGSKSPFKGTFEFLAPEYIWDETVPHSPPTDIWSVGCIFYQLLTQKPLPFASWSGQENRIRYALESIFFFLDPFPVQPSGVEPYPPDLMTSPRKFQFFSPLKQGSWKKKMQDYNVSSTAINLLSQFWEICPNQRISAKTALTHPFFGKEILLSSQPKKGCRRPPKPNGSTQGEQ